MIPNRFRYSDVLDIDRHFVQNTSFGMGIHYCFGTALTGAEIEIRVHVILSGFPELAVS